MNLRRLLLSLTLLTTAAAAAAPALATDGPDRRRAPELWFSPGDDLEVSGVVAHPDYPALFTEPVALAHRPRTG